MPAHAWRASVEAIANGVVIVVMFIAIVITAAVVGDGEGLEQFQQAVGDTQNP